jgi:hypothetical protein
MTTTNTVANPFPVTRLPRSYRTTKSPHPFEWTLEKYSGGEGEPQLIHIVIEEPFGIDALDLGITTCLCSNGMISDKADDISQAFATPFEGARVGKTAFGVDREVAIGYLRRIVLPNVRTTFPRSDQRGSKSI